MMGHLVPVDIGVSDVEVFVQTVALPGSQQTAVLLDNAAAAVSQAFGRWRSVVVRMADQLARSVSEMESHATAPGQVQVEFGLAFTATGGVVVAGVEAGATIKVTLSYERPVPATTTPTG